MAMPNFLYRVMLMCFLASAGSSFANTPPEVPVPDRPVGDSINVNYVKLWCLPTTDAEHNAIQYDFQILNDSADTAPLLIQFGNDNYKNRSEVFEGLSVHRAYWWQVRARDALDTSDWSEPVVFYTKYAAVIDVPSEAATIAEAVAQAVHGDTVMLADGIFTGPGNCDIQLGEQTITICSRHGASHTTIDLAGSPADPHRAFRLHEWDRNRSDKYFATFKGISFENGYAASGAVIIGLSSIAYFDSCVFRNNAARAGGILSARGSIVTFTNCAFEGNSANNGAISDDTAVDFVGCSFTENSSDHYLAGSASGSRKRFEGCVFTQNYIPSSYWYGMLDGEVDIAYSVFHDNDARVLSAFGHITLSHVTIVGNRDGILLGTECRADIDKSIIAYNDGGGITCTQALYPFPDDWSSYLTLTNSDVFGNKYDGSGCHGDHLDTSNVLWVDPQFCDQDGGNFRLQANSPCADAASDGDFIGAFGPGCTPTGIDDDQPVPNSFALSQNYPNPFNAATTIQYSLGARSNVTIEIVNVLGQRVTTLVNATQPAGDYSVVWTGENGEGKLTASGIYFYRLRTETFTQTRKLLLLK